MLLYIFNTFFLCFHTFHLYLHALVTFLKFYHACILVHHGVSGRFTKRKKLCRRDTKVRMPERPEKVRWIQVTSFEFRSQTLSVYGGHHYQIRTCTCIPKYVWYLNVILISDDIINNKSWDRRWRLGRTISRNGMREEEIHVSMCTI